ncbi:MAG: amidohydrolase, partial [Myxococcales bacterium]|nr:amidohydrolase [Myxococcales bacterium]
MGRIAELIAVLATLGLLGCGAAPAESPFGPIPSPTLDPPSLEPPPPLSRPLPAAPAVLIKDATLLTASRHRPRIDRGWIRLRKGFIAEIGEGDAPEPARGERVVDARGHFVTPGIIDTHSHMGVHPQPSVWAHADVNEATKPITAALEAEDGIWPQDPAFEQALAGGVTTVQILPGSANLMGGRSAVLKLHPRREVAAMRFPGAPPGIKMACGENPKRVYGKGKKAMPASRMGSLFLMREAFAQARRYKFEWERWHHEQAHGGKLKGEPPPKRDLTLETLAGVLAGRILVHIHCYRADEMLQQLELAREFGYRVRSFHHAVEAYKIRDILAREGVSVSTWADWYGFKLEAWDGIEQTLPLLTEAGARGILHTDSPEG